MTCAATSQSAFFIPVPVAFAPITNFGCPNPGTVFTYDVMAWNTNRPNRMIAIEQDQFNCRIRSDAQGTYDWFGGLGAHLDDADVAHAGLAQAGRRQLAAETAADHHHLDLVAQRLANMSFDEFEIFYAAVVRHEQVFVLKRMTIGFGNIAFHMQILPIG